MYLELITLERGYVRVKTYFLARWIVCHWLHSSLLLSILHTLDHTNSYVTTSLPYTGCSQRRSWRTVIPMFLVGMFKSGGACREGEMSLECMHVLRI